MDSSKNYVSKEELRTHNKRNDLWISIEGKVYNVTNWVNDHPGGNLPLFYFAGQDVTDVFLSYHPISTWKYLDKYFVGHLSDYEISEISTTYRKLWFDFQKMGLFENKGHGTFILLCISLIMFCVAISGVLSSNNFSIHIACAVILGFTFIQLGWIGHDSAHYQVMINSRVNHFAQFVLVCFTGVSFAWWKKDHNSHHIACNSLEYDPNTQLMPIFAVSPKLFASSLSSYFYETKMRVDSLTRVLVSYQHWTFVPFIAFLRTYLYSRSFSMLLSNKKVPNKVQDLAGMLVFFTWMSLLISCLPNWYERFVFATTCLLTTGIQGFQFSLNHTPCDVYTGPPMGEDWLEKQIIGSLDIACPPWMDWFHGGLQFQIEHHLFPRMPRCQLRTISPYVQELCKEHNLTYNCTSFWEAIKRTINTLRDTALYARKFTINPNHKKLV